jgi:hypothetical protein
MEETKAKLAVKRAPCLPGRFNFAASSVMIDGWRRT